MKKALYYAIRTGSLYNPVIAVTTEKGRHTGSPDRWHGREVNGAMPTHGKMSDLSGKFETQEAAEKMRAKVAQLADSYDDARKVLQQESSRLYATERDAMRQLLAGEDAPLAPRPEVKYVSSRTINAKDD